MRVSSIGYRDIEQVLLNVLGRYVIVKTLNRHIPSYFTSVDAGDKVCGKVQKRALSLHRLLRLRSAELKSFRRRMRYHHDRKTNWICHTRHGWKTHPFQVSITGCLHAICTPHVLVGQTRWLKIRNSSFKASHSFLTSASTLKSWKRSSTLHESVQLNESSSKSKSQFLMGFLLVPNWKRQIFRSKYDEPNVPLPMNNWFRDVLDYITDLLVMKHRYTMTVSL